MRKKRWMLENVQWVRPVRWTPEYFYLSWMQRRQLRNNYTPSTPGKETRHGTEPVWHHTNLKLLQGIRRNQSTTGSFHGWFFRYFLNRIHHSKEYRTDRQHVWIDRQYLHIIHSGMIRSYLGQSNGSGLITALRKQRFYGNEFCPLNKSHKSASWGFMGK